MVSRNKVFIFLSNIRVNGSIKATSLFLARELAKAYKVYFVDYPLTIKDYLSSNNRKLIKERREKLGSFSDGVFNTDLTNLKIVIPPVVMPVNFLPEGVVFRSALSINEALIAGRLKKIISAEQDADIIYVNSFNFHYPGIARRIKPTLSVYHCVDPLIIPYDIKHGFTSEERLVKSSDVVICTSKQLYREKKQINSNTYFIPNAADADHYEKSLDPALPVHPKLKEFSGPVIGYLGAIERRMDYALIRDVALKNPDKNIILAGPVYDAAGAEQIAGIPNIKMLGTIPYEEAPQLLKGFDVAIIPFKKDEVSATIFPLKLFEYLSAGRQVISTNFNTDLKDYTGTAVAYCDDAESFNTSLNDSLRHKTARQTWDGLNIARENTWQKRAAEFAGIIERHLTHRKTAGSTDKKVKIKPMPDLINMAFQQQ